MKLSQLVARVGTAILFGVGGLVALAGAGGTGTASAAAPVRVINYGDSLSMEAGGFFNFFLGPNATVVNRMYGGTSPCSWGADMFAAAAFFRPQAVVMQFSGDAFSPCMGGVVPGTLAYYFKYAADTQDVISLFRSVGARVYVAGYPVSLGDPPWWNVLNQVYAAEAAQNGAVFVDAGASVEALGGFTWTLPCTSFEPCNVPCLGQAVVPGSDCVRDPRGAHLCPGGNEVFTGFIGTCPEWASGAFRYGLAMASGPIRDLGA